MRHFKLLPPTGTSAIAPPGWNHSSVFPPRTGVGRRAPVNPPEPSGELEVRAHQHRPENRLQVQRRGHDDADGPQQRPVPGPRGRRGLQAPGRPAPGSVVTVPCCSARQECSQSISRSVLIVSFRLIATRLGMPSSKESSGRFLTSRRNLKMEVCSVR